MDWPVPYVCAQPYHPGISSQGQLFPPYWRSSAWLCPYRGPTAMPMLMNPNKGETAVHSCDGYAILISPNMGETAVHGCHCRGDMAVRMHQVLARSWVGVCVPLALSLWCWEFERPIDDDIQSLRFVAQKLPAIVCGCQQLAGVTDSKRCRISFPEAAILLVSTKYQRETKTLGMRKLLSCVPVLQKTRN